MWTKEDNIKYAAIWMKEKVRLVEEKEILLKDYKIRKEESEERISIREIYRGGVYWIDFGLGNLGAEKNKTRPALVISANHLNTSETVIVIPLSTKFKYKLNNFDKKIPIYKNHYVLNKEKYTELSEASAIKCEDIRVVDIIRIKDFIFNVSKDDMEKIKLRILNTLGY